MSADLAVQVALRLRLVASPDVTGRVPPESILDRLSAPAPRPSIILGESQSIDPGDSIERNRERIVHTIHVWDEATSREGVKRIMGAIKRAIMVGRLKVDDGLHVADCNVTSMRALSDPDGETAHGVMTVEVLTVETAP